MEKHTGKISFQYTHLLKINPTGTVRFLCLAILSKCNININLCKNGTKIVYLHVEANSAPARSRRVDLSIVLYSAMKVQAFIIYLGVPPNVFDMKGTPS